MKHKILSFVKSGLRIAAFGFVAVFTTSPLIGLTFLTLVAAEVIGVIEEVVV